MKDLLQLLAVVIGLVIWSSLELSVGDESADLENVVGKRVLDLGLVVYPVDGEHYTPTAHRWRTRPRAGVYEVDYAHGKAALAAVKADHRSLARRYDYRPLSGDRWTWRGPGNCRGREWDCIYPEVYDRSGRDLAPLLARFRAHATAEQWSRTDIARWLLAFVQHIEYRLPDDYAFGLLPPALVVSLAWGDCDSKSLLLMQLLDEFGIDSKLLVSAAHAHAMVAIHVPSSGEGFQLQGRRYAWAETTSVDAPLGWRHPKLKSPDDWQVVRTL